MLTETLQTLGVTDDCLAQYERSQLDEQGFVNLGQLIAPELVAQVLGRINDLALSEGSNAGSELLNSPYIRHPKEQGADRLADLVNKGSVFDVFYTHPRVLAAVAHVIQAPFRLSSLNFRAAKPGMGDQQLHVDWHSAIHDQQFLVCNSIWLLDEFSESNGATRIVPGSHRSGQLPADAMDDAWETHPHEVLIEAPAGSVVVFNSHAWHGGTINRTSAARRAIHSYFCRFDQPQQLDQEALLRPETSERLSRAALQLLVESC